MSRAARGTAAFALVGSIADTGVIFSQALSRWLGTVWTHRLERTKLAPKLKILVAIAAVLVLLMAPHAPWDSPDGGHHPASSPSSTSIPAPTQTPVQAMPATGAVKAFDSCFSCFGESPSLSWFQQAKSQGYDLAILDIDSWGSEFPDGNAADPGPGSGCALSSTGLATLNNAIAAGLYVALYNRNLNCYQQTLKSLTPSETHGVSTYIWDVETQPGLIPTQAEISQVTSMGFQNALYTWNGAVDNLGTSFISLPLLMEEVNNWNTPNAGPPTSDYPSINAITPFDGWTSADIEQDSTGQLNGMSLDFDSVSAAWLSTLRSGA
jgi:hypothetical protein